MLSLPAFVAAWEIPAEKQTEALIALLIVIVVAPLLVILLQRAKGGRVKKLAALYESLGYTFRPQATPEDEHLLDGFVLGELYAGGRLKRILNIAQAPANEDGALSIFDFHFRSAFKAGDRDFRFMAARCSHPEIRVPVFKLMPHGWDDRLKRFFPVGPIEFPDDPEFNRLYTLRGVDEAAVRAGFTPELRQALRPFAQFLELEGRDDRLLNMRRMIMSDAAKLVEETKQLAQLFRSLRSPDAAR